MAAARAAGLSHGAESCVETEIAPTSINPQGCGKPSTADQIQAASSEVTIGAIRSREDRNGSTCFHQPMVKNTAPQYVRNADSFGAPLDSYILRNAVSLKNGGPSCNNKN